MKNIFLIISSMVLLNCANTAYYQTWGKNKVRLNSFSSSEGYTVKDSFDISYTRVYMFWGLSNIRDKSLDELLNEVYLKYPNANIGDLKISEEYTFSDGIYDLLTIGIVRPYTLHIKGNIYSQTTRSDLK